MGVIRAALAIALAVLQLVVRMSQICIAKQSLGALEGIEVLRYQLFIKPRVLTSVVGSHRCLREWVRSALDE